MNPILQKSFSAAGASLRRYGWLPLAVFLAHEFCSHVIDGYARWPAIDIPLHFLGGFAIAFFSAGALRVYAERGLVHPPDPILRVLLLFALTCTAAVFWEFAEWTSDRFFGTTCQLSLGDTLLDLGMGVLGGFAFLLPQIPAAGRDFFRPSPGGATVKPQLFLFDLDGTLIDSRADLAAATNRMRKRHGLSPLPPGTVASYVGDGIRTLALRALEGAPVDPDLAAREIGEAYAEHLTDHTTAYPGVDEGLRALRAAGHALALVTNKPTPHARRLFDHFGWTPLFDVLIGGGDVPELKPSPLPLQTAMQRIGRSPADTWMVGDHHTDLEAARRAGVRSIYLESGIGHPGDEKPDLLFPDFGAFAARFLPRA